MASILARAAEQRATFDYDLQGRPLRQLSSAARRELIDAAFEYTQDYRDVDKTFRTKEQLLMAGHQPELFHPGVWFKNVALAHLARQHDAVAVNLLIDDDVCRSAAVRVLGGSAESPFVETIPMDANAGELPYEERPVYDPELFGSFGRRAEEVIRPLVPQTLLGDYWPRAVERLRATGNLGRSLAQSRHQIEADHGMQTLELPQSAMCRLEAFRWFACHLLAQLPRLWDIYNTSLSEYRQTNRIRSRAHPVPDLVEEEGWLEAPFWIWSESNPRRRRLFARQRGEQIVLGDRGEVEIALDLTSEGDAIAAVEQLVAFSSRGIKIRPRALITTMFSRLVLCDLFLHGIGGAKYDELTDLLISRFFQLPPPEFLIVSATVHLPIEHGSATRDDLRTVEHALRELTFHPERFVDASQDGEMPGRADGDASPRFWIDQKRLWVDTEKTRNNARTRHQAIAEANDALQPWVATRRGQLRNERAKIAAALRAAAVLNSREYAFCLHPPETLSRLLLEMRKQSA